MIAIVVFLILTVTLVYIQVSKQGLFSNLIMAALTVVSAMVSFNYYEPLAVKLTNSGFSIGAQGASLLIIFFVTLLALREIFDRVVRGNMNFIGVIDTAGATVFSVISSVIIVGTVMIALQMMPINGGEVNSGIILGFNRVEKMDAPDKSSTIFPGIDSIVANGIGRLSTYSFSGNRQFNHHHPDLLEELYFNRLTLTPGSRQEASSNALTIKHAWLIENDMFNSNNGKKVTLSPGAQFLGVRISLKNGNTKDRPGASDVDDSIRFTMGQMRLVAFNPEGGGEESLSRYPLGVLKPGAQAVELIPLNQGRLYARKQDSLDLLFECPSDLKKFSEQYIEFKRSAFANDHLSTSKLLAAKHKFDIASCRTATAATIVKPVTQKNVIKYDKFVVIPNEEQPLEMMAMMPDKVLSTILEKDNISLLSDFPNGIDSVSVFGYFNAAEKYYTNLKVPKGHVLAYLRIMYLQGVPFEKTPKVIDTNSIAYSPRGYILAGYDGNINAIELIYDCYKQIEPPSFQIFEKGAVLRTAIYLYLLPKAVSDTGIVNVITEQGVCSFQDIDAVLIPKL